MDVKVKSPYANGNLSNAIFNGKSWQDIKLRVNFSTSNCTTSVGLSVQIFNNKDFLRESLFIAKIPLKLGDYQIRKKIYDNVVCLPESELNTNKIYAFYATSQDDGDVGKEEYHVLENNQEIN